jgi:hypothetical protein
MHHPRIGEPLLRKALPELMVNRTQAAPDAQKVAFLLGILLLCPERFPKTADHGPLLLVEITQVALHILQIAEIGEKHVGIHPVFVDLVEIVEQHLSPEIERIETLLMVTRIHPVKLHHGPHPLHRSESRQSAHHLVYRRVAGLPNGTADQPSQLIEKKEFRPRVGQQNPDGRYLLAEFVVKTTRHISKKSLHNPPSGFGSGTPS